MSTEIYAVKEYPRLRALIKRACPDYRKHKVIMQDYGAVTNHGSYWDGGSRSFWATANKFGENVKSVPGPANPPQFGGGDPVRVELDEDTVAIQTGTFRGKKATIVLVTTPATYRWLLEFNNV